MRTTRCHRNPYFSPQAKKRGDKTRRRKKRSGAKASSAFSPLPCPPHPSFSPVLLMESLVATCSDGPVVDSAASAMQEKDGLHGHVDPFLLEVLENSRHRLAGFFSRFGLGIGITCFCDSNLRVSIFFYILVDSHSGLLFIGISLGFLDSVCVVS